MQDQLKNFHQEHEAVVTIGVVDYHLEVPYGVVKVQGVHVLALEEKPSQRFLCNAGIYVLSPEVLKFLPKDQSFDMTDLIEVCLRQGAEKKKC